MEADREIGVLATTGVDFISSIGGDMEGDRDRGAE